MRVAALLILVGLGMFLVTTGTAERQRPPRTQAPASGLRPPKDRAKRDDHSGRHCPCGAVEHVRSRGVHRAPSHAIGLPWAGRLVRGRQLPPSGPGYLTWDPIRKRSPDRGWRRWGTGRLLRALRTVLAAYARRHRAAPPVLVGDLSRRHGGDFGPRFGGIGHVSHQNGLDADVYYPRRDGRLRPARVPAQVDRDAAQELLDAFLRVRGVQRIFVGPSLDLHGPPGVVQPLPHHDDHLHVRLAGSAP